MAGKDLAITGRCLGLAQSIPGTTHSDSVPINRTEYPSSFIPTPYRRLGPRRWLRMILRRSIKSRTIQNVPDKAGKNSRLVTRVLGITASTVTPLSPEGNRERTTQRQDALAHSVSRSPACDPVGNSTAIVATRTNAPPRPVNPEGGSTGFNGYVDGGGARVAKDIGQASEWCGRSSNRPSLPCRQRRRDCRSMASRDATLPIDAAARQALRKTSSGQPRGRSFREPADWIAASITCSSMALPCFRRGLRVRIPCICDPRQRAAMRPQGKEIGPNSRAARVQFPCVRHPQRDEPLGQTRLSFNRLPGGAR